MESTNNNFRRNDDLSIMESAIRDLKTQLSKLNETQQLSSTVIPGISDQVNVFKNVVSMNTILKMEERTGSLELQMRTINWMLLNIYQI